MSTDEMSGQHENSRLARERVLADLRALSHDAETLLAATASDVSDKATEARARLSEAVRRAKATCNELQRDTIASARAAAERGEEMVKTHPYESMGAAFGLGLLFGLLLGRK